MKKLVLITVLAIASSGALATSNTSALVKQGISFWSKNQTENAEKTFRKIIDIAPDNPVGYAKLADLYLTHNRVDEAIPLYQNAIQLDPENAKLFLGLSLAYIHKQEFSKASAMASQAQAINSHLKQADKLLQYIAKKEEALDMLARASQADNHAVPATSAPHSVRLHQKSH